MKKLTIACALSAVLLGCGGGGSGSSNDRDATLNLSVTDAPIMLGTAQITNVFVQFHGIELHGPSGTTTIDLAPPKQIDLLTLTGTNAAALLQNTRLPAGDYQWIRLLVDTDGTLDTYFVDNSGSHELTIPSGAETGLKLNRGFTLAQGGIANFTIDFNVAHSLVSNNNGFILKPVLRLVNNEEVGTFAGTIRPELLTNCADTSTDAGAVYIYSGAVTPTDISGAVTDPVTTARVALDGTNSFTIGYLQAGTYTVAWTCQESSDDPAQVNNLTFYRVNNIAITAGMTTTLEL